MSPYTYMTRNPSIQTNFTFPAFAAGEKRVITLFEVTNVNGDVDAAFIDGKTM